MNHATVRIDGKEIPLIGIPPESTQQRCEVFGKSFHLCEIRFNYYGSPMCVGCLEGGKLGSKKRGVTHSL